MKIMSQSQARKNFFTVAKEVNKDSIPVIATNKDNDSNVVIMSQADYESLQETLYLLSITGMREKLEEAEKEEGIPFSGNLEAIPNVQP